VANVAARESRNGNFDRAEQLLLRLINLPQPAPLAFSELFNLYDSWGRFADAIALAKQSTRHFASSGIDESLVWLDESLVWLDESLVWLAWSYANLGMAEDADYWTGLALADAQDYLQNLDLTYSVLRTRDSDSELGAELGRLVEQAEFHPGEDNPWTLAQFGLVNIQLGNFETGSEQLQLGLRLFQVGPGNTEPADSVDIAAFRGTDPADVVYLMHLLASAYQQIGRNEKADTILQALEDEFGLEHNALHFALTGDSARALHAMRSTMEGRAAKYYGPGKYYEIVNDPAWVETIKAPEFQALLGEVKKDVERQRAIVEAVDAEHDFRAEAAALLETRKKP
jgi:tetratricopeptide (TPR) repeat protein